MSRISGDMQRAVPVGFAAESKNAQIGHVHSGEITIKGVNNQGEFIGALELVMDEMRKSNRR